MKSNTQQMVIFDRCLRRGQTLANKFYFTFHVLRCIKFLAFYIRIIKICFPCEFLFRLRLFDSAHGFRQKYAIARLILNSLTAMKHSLFDVFVALKDQLIRNR